MPQQTFFVWYEIGDTISEKIVSSSKAKELTEKCEFHNSHLKGKNVYRHQLVTAFTESKRYLVGIKGFKNPYRDVKQNQITWIYKQAQAGAPLEQDFQDLKVV